MVLIPQRNNRFKSDLEEVFVYIGEDNTEAALVFLAEIEKNIEQLTRHPNLGRIVFYDKSKYQNLRAWVIPKYKNYRIFYQVKMDAGEIVLLRFLNTYRDFDAIFNDG